jgi:hypothetical protein
VIYDLIRALPVAFVVCLLPGYFWTRLLCSTEDLAVRIAYSMALSITLVPAVALGQIRILDTGLTFTVAVSSVLIVLVAGLAAYAKLGSAKGSVGPLLTRPSAPHVPALALLGLAFAFALLGHIFGLPDWLVWAGASLLVLSGGAIHLLSTSEGDPPSEDETSEDRAGSAARYVLLSVVLLLVLARGYLGPVLQDWPYLRGDDQYEHTVMTEMVISEGSTASFMLYPPGIHLMMAEVSQLSGLEPLEIFAVLVSALLVPPTLALYALARRLWGWEYGVAAALFYGVLAGGPYWYLEHGRYPNIIAAQFLMVLALAALFRTYDSPTWRSGLLLALLGSSVVLYHQVGSLYLALLLGVVALLSLPHALLRERGQGLVLVLWFGLLGVLSVLYAWNTYDLPQMAANLLGGQETGRGGEAVSMAIGTKPPESFTSLIQLTSLPVLLFGLLGALLLLFGRGRGTGMTSVLVRVVLILWTSLMFVGSRTAYSGFPDRFERDLGVPLALLAALAFVTVLRSATARRGTLAVVAASLTVLVTATLVHLRAAESLVAAAEPSAQLTMSPQVAAAGEWLEEHNAGGNIVVSPYVDRVPSRGLLAMGGYTGMQSYDAPRIRRGRDIPPFGPEPMWDALWLLEHPEGEKTRRLLDEYDVRYVVLSKIYPTEAWQSFASREDLYRTVFENESVVVFKPRESLRAGTPARSGL